MRQMVAMYHQTNHAIHNIIRITFSIQIMGLICQHVERPESCPLSRLQGTDLEMNLEGITRTDMEYFIDSISSILCYLNMPPAMLNLEMTVQLLARIKWREFSFNTDSVHQIFWRSKICDKSKNVASNVKVKVQCLHCILNLISLRIVVYAVFGTVSVNCNYSFNSSHPFNRSSNSSLKMSNLKKNEWVQEHCVTLQFLSPLMTPDILAHSTETGVK
jgi:hypothetical protein